MTSHNAVMSAATRNDTSGTNGVTATAVCARTNAPMPSTPTTDPPTRVRTAQPCYILLMRANDRGRTFTETARRAQIVSSAIATIAEHGYGAASFSRIAKHAGLSSTGMISYHFANKDDLIGEVLTEATTVAGNFILPRMDAVTGYRERLRARLESNMELVRVHPQHVRTLMEIALNAPVRPDFVDSRLELFVTHLREGQKAGAFGQFDPEAMTLAIVGAIDTTVTVLSHNLDLDAIHYGRELADTFDRATRAS